MSNEKIQVVQLEGSNQAELIGIGEELSRVRDSLDSASDSSSKLACALNRLTIWGLAKELEIVRDRAFPENRNFMKRSLLSCAVIIFGASLAINYLDISNTLAIMLIISICTLCVIAIINSSVRALHVPLLLLIASTEWVARKGLGEYESPE